MTWGLQDPNKRSHWASSCRAFKKENFCVFPPILPWVPTLSSLLPSKLLCDQTKCVFQNPWKIAIGHGQTFKVGRTRLTLCIISSSFLYLSLFLEELTCFSAEQPLIYIYNVLRKKASKYKTKEKMITRWTKSNENFIAVELLKRVHGFGEV